jgi:hypothetical protein
MSTNLGNILRSIPIVSFIVTLSLSTFHANVVRLTYAQTDQNNTPFIADYEQNNNYPMSESDAINTKASANYILLENDNLFLPLLTTFSLINPEIQAVLHLKFDENEGETTFRDASGRGNNGYCTGTSCPASGVPHKYGRALHLDGIDDKVLIWDTNDLDISLQDDFTIQAWINLASANCGFCRIFNKFDGGRGYSFDAADNYGNPRLTLYLNDGLNNGITRANTSLSINKWHQVAAVYSRDNNFVTLYVDGKETDYQYRQNLVAVGDVSNQTMAVIGNQTGESSYFHGMIDELIVYKGALNAQEILALYNKYEGNYR